MKASEMLAAKKAAKKEQAVKKYARDNIGNQRADRNKLANIAVIQTQNKLSLRSGAPQDLDSKLEVLNAAWHFFRVAECNSAVQPVNSIPELRQDGYKILADFDRLKDFIQTAMQKILIPFEQNTGISLINYNQFRKDLVQAEII